MILVLDVLVLVVSWKLLAVLAVPGLIVFLGLDTFVRVLLVHIELLLSVLVVLAVPCLIVFLGLVHIALLLVVVELVLVVEQVRRKLLLVVKELFEELFEEK
jgi:hypothetical protein